MNGRSVDLLSPLPLDRCRDVLHAAIDRPWALFGDRPVIGRISGTKLRARKRIWYSNAFQTYVCAEMSRQDGPTQIRCRFSIQPLVLVFFTVWISLTLAFCAWGSFLLFYRLIVMAQTDPAHPWWSFLVPFVVPLSGFGLVQFSRYLARNERRFLIEFLCAVLRAELTPRGTRAG